MQQRRDWKRPLWLMGFAIFITSNILGSVFQIGALPIVILAPLGAVSIPIPVMVSKLIIFCQVSLLWNALFAKFLLGDIFSRYLIIGALHCVYSHLTAHARHRYNLDSRRGSSDRDLRSRARNDTHVGGAAALVLSPCIHRVDQSPHCSNSFDPRSGPLAGSIAGTQALEPIHRSPDVRQRGN